MSSPTEVPTQLHPFAKPAAPADHFVTVVRGEGALVFDADGNEYVDGMASLWFANVGYGRSEVVDAITEQARTLHAYHCFDPFTNGPADALAERLAGLAPVEDPRVFFTSSGSESVDSAIKLARAAHIRSGHPERTLIVSRSAGYHGVTFGGTSAQGIPDNREGWGPLVEDIFSVPGDDIEAMATLFAERGEQVAAVITEPLQGAGGVFPPPEGYLTQLRRLCDDHGAFMIVDEVICAFGRLGRWFGCEHYDVRPDLITFAKGVTSGYVPLGGVIVGGPVHTALEADPDFILRHGHTYSGHATAAAAALANLDVLDGEGLLDRALAVGSRLSDGLRSLQADGLVTQVRGEGAVWAVELPEGRPAPAARDALLGEGVIVRPLGTALAMCPPLVITDEQVDRIVDGLATVLGA
jgi:adenosylmethionine-8-amino-7-oxononanoate aminotransferase